MAELSSYSLMDLMPMEPEVYFRLFERLNQSAWPAQFAAQAMGVALLWFTWHHRVRPTAIFMAIAWVWVGLEFHLRLFAELNWAARYIAWAFFAQSGLLVVLLGLYRPRKILSYAGGDQRMFRAIVTALAGALLWLYPLYTLLGERTWRGMEIFAIAPDPTALFTLILLLLPRRIPWLLSIIPVLWCFYSGAVWWAMGWHQGLILPLFAVAFVITGLWKTVFLRRRKERSGV